MGMRIFVSIASYRDRELVKTIKSLISNARFPQNLHIGVLSQDENKKHPDLSFVKNRLTYQKMSMKDARGAGYARKICMEMYDGEDYFLQIDSHMRFAPNWDVRLITMLQESQEIAKNQKVILSQFPAPYQLWTNGKEHYPKDDASLWSEPSWTTVEWSWKGVWIGVRQPIKDKSKPHKSHTVLAGYIFAPGSFIEELPYDERISFMGEELCIALRAYTRGWDIYAPNEMLIWHFYGRREHPKVWNQRDDMVREHKWHKLEEESHKIQRAILTGEEEGIFGIVKNRRYTQYQKMIGKNFKEFYEQLDNKGK
jgi:glycosyltransferase involved in cell wall biosynthesis